MVFRFLLRTFVLSRLQILLIRISMSPFSIVVVLTLLMSMRLLRKSVVRLRRLFRRLILERSLTFLSQERSNYA